MPTTRSKSGAKKARGAKAPARKAPARRGKAPPHGEGFVSLSEIKEKGHHAYERMVKELQHLMSVFGNLARKAGDAATGAVGRGSNLIKAQPVQRIANGATNVAGRAVRASEAVALPLYAPMGNALNKTRSALERGSAPVSDAMLAGIDRARGTAFWAAGPAERATDAAIRTSIRVANGTAGRVYDQALGPGINKARYTLESAGRGPSEALLGAVGGVSNGVLKRNNANRNRK